VHHECLNLFCLKFQGLGSLINFWKAMFWYITMFFNSVTVFYYVLIQVTFVGVFSSITYLTTYIDMSSKGQTCFDRKRERDLKLTPRIGSYYTFEKFLGPQAILRILFPLCFSAPTGTQHDPMDFIAKFNEMKKNSKTRVRISLNTAWAWSIIVIKNWMNFHVTKYFSHCHTLRKRN